ncbi:hypothetical protein MKX01_032708 [Papaver californicum]|nr:hypothetical protein MKX01_032708 [Papaver californicum]
MPLLEETRMEICSQMEFMSGVPHAEVISAEESKLHGGSFLYCIEVDFWRNRCGAYADLAAKCFMELRDFKRAGMIYLEYCGESRLEDAGDCFSLAGCWSTAADVYSRCNCFSKCLLVCTNGNLFETGLQFIEYWKESARLNPDTAKSQDLIDMEQSFLKRCALHYHQQNDTNNMMKFIKAFNSLDMIRTFLRSRDYLDELVLLKL